MFPLASANLVRTKGKKRKKSGTKQKSRAKNTIFCWNVSHSQGQLRIQPFGMAAASLTLGIAQKRKEKQRTYNQHIHTIQNTSSRQSPINSKQSEEPMNQRSHSITQRAKAACAITLSSELTGNQQLTNSFNSTNN